MLALAVPVPVTPSTADEAMSEVVTPAGRRAPPAVTGGPATEMHVVAGAVPVPPVVAAAWPVAVRDRDATQWTLAVRRALAMQIAARVRRALAVQRVTRVRRAFAVQMAAPTHFGITVRWGRPDNSDTARRSPTLKVRPTCHVADKSSMVHHHA
ncbi:hypothetical protein [Actinoplanes sp. NPDC026623]|uniref:hypothetical protein n=1 Tax=Actinoplanes sp. NPDC026623 TaxID=3155610 RepID=UPI0033D1E29C